MTAIIYLTDSFSDTLFQFTQVVNAVNRIVEDSRKIRQFLNEELRAWRLINSFSDNEWFTIYASGLSIVLFSQRTVLTWKNRTGS
jgi:hypothetical protein